MTTECVKIKQLRPIFKLPKAQTEFASGLDLRYCGELPITIPQYHLGVRIMLPLGFSMELPPGYEAQIRPRSGLAAKNGLTILNAPGTIDADYRSEVCAILVRTSTSKLTINEEESCVSEIIADKEFVINPGDRICQMVIQKLPQVRLMMVDELSTTDRGEGGFGSTGGFSNA